jgi:subtilase family serine protease
MKRFMTRAMLALAATAVVLTARVGIVHGPRATDHTLTMASWSAQATRHGVVPCIRCIASQPVIPGQPAVSLAPDGTTWGPFHAYAPADLCAAYGVDQLHAEGLLGQGQTIVLTEWYGSPTALEDLQAFSQAFGLPAPDLTVLYPNGVPTYSSMKADYRNGWAGETSLDLQWAHAIAPCARLVMIVANGGGIEVSGMFKGIASAVQQYPRASAHSVTFRQDLTLAP